MQIRKTASRADLNRALFGLFDQWIEYIRRKDTKDARGGTSNVFLYLLDH